MLVSYKKLLLLSAKKQLNISVLLKNAGVSVHAFNTIKAGRAVRLATLGKLAAALGVEPAELLAEGGE